MNNTNIILQTVDTNQCDATKETSKCDMKAKDKIEENGNNQMEVMKMTLDSVQIKQIEVCDKINLHSQ